AYTIHPETFQFYTTDSHPITLSASTPNVSGISFEQHPHARTITPMDKTAAQSIVSDRMIDVYPNPSKGGLNIIWKEQAAGSADVTITDVTGRVVFSSVINMAAASGQEKISINELKDGIYHLAIHSANINYSNKLQIQH